METKPIEEKKSGPRTRPEISAHRGLDRKLIEGIGGGQGEAGGAAAARARTTARARGMREESSSEDGSEEGRF